MFTSLLSLLITFISLGTPPPTFFPPLFSTNRAEAAHGSERAERANEREMPLPIGVTYALISTPMPTLLYTLIYTLIKFFKLIISRFSSTQKFLWV